MKHLKMKKFTKLKLTRNSAPLSREKIMGRITLEDTTKSAIVKMADGNPGAIGAIMSVFESREFIDPQAAMGPLGVLLSLDYMGIYGTDIYVLFSDKCKKDARLFLVLLRAVQLGFLPRNRLAEMAADQSRSVNISVEEIEELDLLVCGQLSEFQKKPSK